MASDPTALLASMVANLQAVPDFPTPGQSPVISNTALLKAIAQAIVDNCQPPTGSVIQSLATVAPAGWILLGAAQNVLRATYPALFALFGTTYGAGDGTTTFGLPPSNAVFFRNTGTQVVGGISYSGPAVGAFQSDSIQGHSHALQFDSGVVSNGATGAGTAFNGTIAHGNGVASSTLLASLGLPRNDTVNGVPRTATETRPVSLGVNVFLKT